MRVPRLVQIAALSPGAAALLGTAGCRYPDLAERRVAPPCERIARSLKTLAKQEQARTRRLTPTLSEIHRAVRRDAEASRANFSELELYWHREWQQWIERQPDCWREAGRPLRGRPDRIERNAITLLF